MRFTISISPVSGGGASERIVIDAPSMDSASEFADEHMWSTRKANAYKLPRRETGKWTIAFEDMKQQYVVVVDAGAGPDDRLAVYRRNASRSPQEREMEGKALLVNELNARFNTLARKSHPTREQLASMDELEAEIFKLNTRIMALNDELDELDHSRLRGGDYAPNGSTRDDLIAVGDELEREQKSLASIKRPNAAEKRRHLAICKELLAIDALLSENPEDDE